MAWIPRGGRPSCAATTASSLLTVFVTDDPLVRRGRDLRRRVAGDLDRGPHPVVPGRRLVVPDRRRVVELGAGQRAAVGVDDDERGLARKDVAALAGLLHEESRVVPAVLLSLEVADRRLTLRDLGL